VASRNDVEKRRDARTDRKLGPFVFEECGNVSNWDIRILGQERHDSLLLILLLFLRNGHGGASI